MGIDSYRKFKKRKIVTGKKTESNHSQIKDGCELSESYRTFTAELEKITSCGQLFDHCRANNEKFKEKNFCTPSKLSNDIDYNVLDPNSIIYVKGGNYNERLECLGMQKKTSRHSSSIEIGNDLIAIHYDKWEATKIGDKCSELLLTMRISNVISVTVSRLWDSSKIESLVEIWKNPASTDCHIKG